MALETLSVVFGYNLQIRVSRDFGSVSETMAYLWPLAMIVSSF